MKGPGIDYGNGLANIDRATGIRYGVISQNSISPEVWGEFEAEYPDVEHDDDCTNTDDESYCSCGDMQEPIGFKYERDGYVLTSGTDGFGIFVLKAPHYTHAMFCSPCAPGAGNLDSPSDDGVKTYALGADFFEDEIAPYPLHDVEINHGT